MDPSKLSPSAKQVFNLIEFDENEKLLYEIRKHFFGLFLIYFMGTFVTFALLAIAMFAAVFMEGDPINSGFNLTSLRGSVIAVTILLSVFSLLLTAVAAYLYRSNVILVTSEKISQVVNPSLFNRKISQLSIGDVQDVSVHQRGIFAHAFHFGTLVLETAGEQQNYTFTYVPAPYEAAKAIVNAHEENLKLYGN